jgi:crossover junction endodeoxyribonuclease RuvC
MTRILALDQSAFTGFCHGEPGGQPIQGCFRLASKLMSERANVLEDFVIDLVKGSGITAVYFEQPIIPKNTSFVTLAPLIGYAVIIAKAARRLSVPSYPVHQQSWRSEFGVPTQAPRKIKSLEDRRKWVKAATIERCRKLGYDPKDDNAADAIGIWSVACSRILKQVNEPTFDLFASELV